MGKDYYQILGVARGASSRQIKKAYRSLALKYHPDRVSAELKEQAGEMFKEISEAYRVLSDPRQRRAYRPGGDSKNDQSFFDADALFREAAQQKSSRETRRESFSSYFELNSKNKIAAVMVCGLYLAVGLFRAGFDGFFFTLFALPLPLVLIFFPDFLGDFTGSYHGSLISPTPAPFMVLIGWVMLLFPVWMPLLNYLCSL